MPIDIGSGNVYFDYDEVSVPGKVSLTWNRYFSSHLCAGSASILGIGWKSRFEMGLEFRLGMAEFTTATGALISFSVTRDALHHGKISRNFEESAELFWNRQRYVVQTWDVHTGEIWRFCFTENEPTGSLELTSIEDVCGQGLELEYTADGKLNSIRQRMERRVLRLKYNSVDLVDSVELESPNGRRHQVALYEYDFNSRLIASYNRAGLADRYEYRQDGRIERELLKDGGIFTYDYDDLGRCIHVSGLDRFNHKRLKFLDAARVVEVTNSVGAKWRYTHRADGQIVSEADPHGANTQTEYDEYGRIVKKTAANGAELTYQFDDQGNIASTTNAIGEMQAFFYNSSHLPIKVVDSNEGIWTNEYNSAHQLIAQVDPLGNQLMLGYDEIGNLVSVTNSRGNKRTFEYENGVLITSVDAGGHASRYTYDDFGKLTSSTDPNGNRTDFRYDVCGNPVGVTFPDGRTISAFFDAASNLIQITDGQSVVLTRRFGGCGRLIEETDANGGTRRFSWGSEPYALTAISNEIGEYYQFEYDACGRCIQETGFDGRVTAHRYDTSGNYRSRVNGNGEVIEFQRDALGRVLGIQGPDGRFVRFSYFPNGTLAEAENNECLLIFERDLLGRLTKEVQQTRFGKYATEFTRDSLGDLLKVESDLGPSIEYDLDANGMWSRLVTDTGYEIYFVRDNCGREVIRGLPGNWDFQQVLDELGRPIEQRLVARSMQVSRSLPTSASTSIKAIVERTIERNTSGLVRLIASSTDQARIDTDEIGRLVGFTANTQPNEQFEYDELGNMTRHITDRNSHRQDLQLRYATGNRLAAVDNAEYVYDGHGRLMSREDGSGSVPPRIWKYEWDSLDHLVSVVSPEGIKCEYSYDAFSRRIEKRVDGRGIHYIWMGSVPFLERSIESKQLQAYLFSQDSFVPLAQIRNREFYSILCDHIGTPSEMIDRSGNRVWTKESSVYGIRTAPNHDNEYSCPFSFQGHYWDAETGLHYNRFRYYEAETGRYLSQDPIGVLGGTNLYNYVRNPTYSVDVVGLAPPCQKQKDRARKAAEKTMADAADGKVRERPDYHGRLPDDVVAGILAKPDAVFLSEGSAGRLIFSKDGNVVITEGVGSNRGQTVTSFGPGGPQGTSGASIFGGAPTDPGKPVTPQMITGGTIPTPGGGTNPPGHQVWP